MTHCNFRAFWSCLCKNLLLLLFHIYFIILTFRRIEFYSWQQETFASFHRMIVGFAGERRNDALYSVLPSSTQLSIIRL